MNSPGPRPRPLRAVSEIHGSTVTGFTVYTDAGLCFRLGFDNYGNKFKRLAPVDGRSGEAADQTGVLLIDLADPTKITVQPRRLVRPLLAEPAQATGPERGRDPWGRRET